METAMEFPTLERPYTRVHNVPHAHTQTRPRTTAHTKNSRVYYIFTFLYHQIPRESTSL